MSEIKTRFGARVEDIKSSTDLFYLESYSYCANSNEEMEAQLLFEKTNDIKVVDDFLREKKNKKLAEKYKKEANISERFKTRTFDNFNVVNDMHKKAFDKAFKYAEEIKEHIKNGTNIIFVGGGSYGTGKTHLACAIANKILDNGIPVKVLNITTLVDELKEFSQKFKQELKTVKVLLIDDMGKENGTSWLCSEIYGIINARYENNLPTIITTEGTLNDLENNYKIEIDGRIVNRGCSMISRLMESCFLVKMSGADYRANKGLLKCQN